MTFRDLKSFGARLSDLSRTLAGDPKMRVSDLKLSTLNVQLPVVPNPSPQECWRKLGFDVAFGLPTCWDTRAFGGGC